MLLPHMKKTVLAVLAVLALAAPAMLVAQTAQKLNVTGAWIFEVTTDAGTGTPTVTFKQDGETITGHYSSMTLGEADLTGTLKGTALVFKFPVEGIGDVTYTATVESNTAMKGTLDIAGQASGTFTGKPKPAQ